jgi:CheY-like chemotaxis protein
VITILIADDDPEDCTLARDALAETGMALQVRFPEDGEALLDYLRQKGAYAGVPHPSLILLDLNMPKKDGREALEEIKSDPNLRYLPVVVLTTSKASDDIERSYDLGANSFIVKPASYRGWVEVMQGLTDYWFQLVEPSARPVGR